jgi:hypothetical protein
MTDPIAIRNAALREAAAKIREMGLWKIEQVVDANGRAWPLRSAYSIDDYANAILDMIEEDATE